MSHLKLRLIFAIIFCITFLSNGNGQEEKTIVHNAHFWTSYNNVFRLSNSFALLNDFHIRRTRFVVDPSFYFLRFGARYWIESNLNVSGGYAHMWLAPRQEGWTTFADENRLYQELQMVGFFNKSSVLFRVRNEQRWREQIADDVSTGIYKFNIRIRMLLSASIPLGDNPKSVRLMFANEIHFNLGKNIVFNTFDQNRFTVGINQRINHNWRYDLGYMIIYQQRADGSTYDVNHTLRIFFYGLFDFRRSKPLGERSIIEHAEE